ncbi:hypothetical protein BO70DRAFT_198763 [Aspergillus heteromorphus CBS 117.55]|uniref:Uncharacterized protein n=1 Tax=Aspergillus heteromorphus CBS 117.55 TaxID=1448321 RepID=A0A317WNS2_9EURO|nr:uncharacterized protein BO70DRAFT_198763 [Aspergillus heteromorphus CBS 117.55]PWY87635.1 hypothetical protein BO70DRAFT_198763 [Aspergillus heteromorphus CBS 117.55]
MICLTCNSKEGQISSSGLWACAVVISFRRGRHRKTDTYAPKKHLGNANAVQTQVLQRDNDKTRNKKQETKTRIAGSNNSKHS